MDPIDELFIFLEPGSDPAAARVRQDHEGGTAMFAWVPDGAAAARVAAEVAEQGVRLIELYRGFDLASSARVIEAVGGRAPVGVAGYGFGSAPSVDRIVSSVTIYGEPNADPDAHRVVRDSVDNRTTVVPVPDADSAVRVALEQAELGVDVIEICGGTPLTTAHRVQEAVGDRVPVSLVSWPFESIDAAAAYKAEFEEGTAA